MQETHLHLAPDNGLYFQKFIISVIPVTDALQEVRGVYKCSTHQS
jgi:hypothetical protein